MCIAGGAATLRTMHSGFGAWRANILCNNG
jgi:hypothetical protein